MPDTLLLQKATVFSIIRSATSMQLDHLEGIASFFAVPMLHLFVYSESEWLLL